MLGEKGFGLHLTTTLQKKCYLRSSSTRSQKATTSVSSQRNLATNKFGSAHPCPMVQLVACHLYSTSTEPEESCRKRISSLRPYIKKASGRYGIRRYVKICHICMCTYIYIDTVCIYIYIHISTSIYTYTHIPSTAKLVSGASRAWLRASTSRCMDRSSVRNSSDTAEQRGTTCP